MNIIINHMCISISCCLISFLIDYCYPMEVDVFEEMNKLDDELNKIGEINPNASDKIINFIEVLFNNKILVYIFVFLFYLIPIFNVFMVYKKIKDINRR